MPSAEPPASQQTRKPRKPTPGAPLAAEHPVYSREELQKILSERESWTAGELAETLAHDNPNLECHRLGRADGRRPCRGRLREHASE